MFPGYYATRDSQSHEDHSDAGTLTHIARSPLLFQLQILHLPSQQPRQGASGFSSIHMSLARVQLLEATESELTEMLQDIGLHKQSMRALESNSSDHNTRLANLQRIAARRL